MLDYRRVINEGAQIARNLCKVSGCTNKRERHHEFCAECLEKRKIHTHLFRKRQKSPNSWIYFIRSGESVKIGVTGDIKARKCQLQTSTPDELETLLCVPGNERDEKFVHSLFEKQHIRGEWFKLDDEILRYIKLLNLGLGVYKTCEIAFEE